MRHRIYNLMKRMDIKDLNTQLALQCTPVITGLKVANLLILQNNKVEYLKRIIGETRLLCFMFFQSECKTIILLYNKSLLQSYLSQKQVRAFLEGMGYELLDLNDILSQLQFRYEAYKIGLQEFPHEIGLILGYPLEDVEGFIKNQGQNSLYTGYWKVYDHLPEKMHLFSEFELAEETILRQVLNGVNMIAIINSNFVDQIT